jgi:hypothetical protein
MFDPKFIGELLLKAPLTALVLAAYMIYRNIKMQGERQEEHGKSIDYIMKNMVPEKDLDEAKKKIETLESTFTQHKLTSVKPKDLQEVKDDLTETKKTVQWVDTCKANVKGIEARITRLEHASNGKTG